MLMRPEKEAGAAKMATERSRSPMGGSPVPASMFAPEPASHGGAVAASSRFHRGVADSDCSEDGEVLNGEPELDLTSKVGPAAGGQRRPRAPPAQSPVPGASGPPHAPGGSSGTSLSLRSV